MRTWFPWSVGCLGRTRRRPGEARPELKLIADRLERLQRITAELNAAATIDDVTSVVMHALDAPIQAPSRALWLHEPGTSQLELVTESGLAPDAVQRHAQIDVESDLPGAVAYREQRTVTSGPPEQADLAGGALRGVERSTERFVIVPLLFEGACLGVLALGYSHELDTGDIGFLETITGQVAQTLVRVRLAERDRRRREELEFLADLTDAALASTDHLELMDNVTSAAVPMLGACCSLYFLPEDGEEPLAAVAHVDPVKVPWAQQLQARFRYEPDGEHGVAAVIRTGETEFIANVTGDVIEAIAHSGGDPQEIRRILDALDLTSVITVPLLTKRRIVGAMQFASAGSGRRYDLDDVALAEAVAGRLAEALDASWLSEQHRRIAVTLQRALLPPRIPPIPGIDIAERYWPAAGAQVGGDFYDVFAIDRDRWSIVIGDACGTGPNAAALTSIARHTVRAAARHGITHHEVMDWLNEAVLRSDRDLFCTACYATIDQHEGAWRLTSVAAGHPLPIITSRDAGTVRIGQPGTLLGAFEDVRMCVGTTALVPGDVVVFYTDGVTDLPPPSGLTEHEMLDLVESLRDRGSAASIADGIHESVIERVPERGRQDDIAVVVLRVTGD
jgi:serine phosphatase RsbU (regulator of sigma subunit)